jgi:hypothetical protein
MPKATPSTPQRLQQLIAERQRYEEWLSGLEARRASVPVQVFTRVEEDYRKRLTHIADELSARVGEVRDRITALTERLASVLRDENTRREALEEAELRTAIGEYTKDQWTARKADADRALAELATQRHSIEAEVLQLQQIVAQSTAQPRAAPPPPPPPAPAPPAPAPTATARPTSAPAPPAVATPMAASAAPERPQGVRPDSSPDAPGWSQRTGNTPGRERAAGTPPSPASLLDQTLPGSGSLTRQTPARGHYTGQSSAKEETPPQVQQEKTLRCQECATLNYPTEWYCESCGAELAAL